MPHPMSAGPVEELLAYYTGEGFEVRSQTSDEIELLRENDRKSWLLSVLIAPLTQIPATPRRQRLWLHLDGEGYAEARLYSRNRPAL